jgi:hypothetical protein
MAEKNVLLPKPDSWEIPIAAQELLRKQLIIKN